MLIKKNDDVFEARIIQRHSVRPVPSHIKERSISTRIQRLPLLVDNRLLLSYNHLLLNPAFTRLPPMGDGVAGPKLDSLKDEVLRASGEAGDP